VDPILKAVDEEKDTKIHSYEPGSMGPKEADDFILRDGRSWRPIK
jgi:glucose-6-phosphate 1-dehydrogenase